MTFVELLACLGGMGRFQVTYVAALAIPLLMLASHNLLQNFTAGVPEHHCRPRPMANDSTRDVPLLVSVPSDGHHRPQRCRRYVEPQWHLLEVNGTVNGTANGAATEPCHDGWTYHDSVFAHTIVTEWDLVCESKTLRQVAQSIYMAGILLGSGLFGVLSDNRFGRRALLTWCYLQLGVTGAGTAAAPTFVVYCLCRFLAGLAMAGVSLNSASLCMEWIPTEARAVVGTINGYCYTLGQFVLAATAFGVPHWRWLQLVVSLPFFLFFLYSWYGEPGCPAGRLPPSSSDWGGEGGCWGVWVLRALVRREPPLPGGTLAALVRTPGMRTVSCGVSFVWQFCIVTLRFGDRFSTSFAYYGLAMDLQGFGVDIYLSQLVFGAVDIPAKLASVLAISCVGRRVAQGGSLALAGICILANIVVPMELQTLRMAFAVIGKGSLAASFNCAYIFSGELFPTVIRQTGMGLGGTMARVGGMVAPLVSMAADVTPVLPLVIYGAAPIISAIATCFLPETRNMPLPETVKDVERR
ncbi:S226B protein, partial [Pandion haliaetus]|nr:S226B protein [Pandion haliaetus]